jgi:hypothetical protein
VLKIFTGGLHVAMLAFSEQYGPICRCVRVLAYDLQHILLPLSVTSLTLPAHNAGLLTQPA